MLFSEKRTFHNQLQADLFAKVTAHQEETNKLLEEIETLAVRDAILLLEVKIRFNSAYIHLLKLVKTIL